MDIGHTLHLHVYVIVYGTINLYEMVLNELKIIVHVSVKIEIVNTEIFLYSYIVFLFIKIGN